VRRDAEGKNRNYAEVAAREKIQHAEQGAADVMPDFPQPFRVDAGSRNVSAKAVDRKQAQSEKDPLAQIRHIEHVANGGEKFFHIGTSVMFRVGLKLDDRRGPTRLLDLFARAFRE